ncbi:hypothetical protein SAMN06296036_11519 [Pseudobacteriovorax antillogorgiicola]|uniref:Uncharacterized protein n=1 Tax=Pseudobacteriovorax antillogorgiicola TaxID=1513793 RepID=A0A1Y6C8C9_9BACT|nr:hypothetical protein EDD56_11050 [Pseudobacteriovorax antillogorgiicola]SMF48941.1 hypothetical protein SAMN06296036_11519 [Pseudobacteriovorax antillogorgiicola]
MGIKNPHAIANCFSIMLASLALPLLNYRSDHVAWMNDPYLIAILSIAAFGTFFIRDKVYNVIYAFALILLCYFTMGSDFSTYTVIFLIMFFFNLLAFVSNRGIK